MGNTTPSSSGRTPETRGGTPPSRDPLGLHNPKQPNNPSPPARETTRAQRVEDVRVEPAPSRDQTQYTLPGTRRLRPESEPVVYEKDPNGGWDRITNREKPSEIPSASPDESGKGVTTVEPNRESKSTDIATSTPHDKYHEKAETARTAAIQAGLPRVEEDLPLLDSTGTQFLGREITVRRGDQTSTYVENSHHTTETDTTAVGLLHKPLELPTLPGSTRPISQPASKTAPDLTAFWGIYNNLFGAERADRELREVLPPQQPITAPETPTATKSFDEAMPAEIQGSTNMFHVVFATGLDSTEQPVSLPSGLTDMPDQLAHSPAALAEASRVLFERFSLQGDNDPSAPAFRQLLIETRMGLDPHHPDHAVALQNAARIIRAAGTM